MQRFVPEIPRFDTRDLLTNFLFALFGIGVILLSFLLLHDRELIDFVSDHTSLSVLCFLIMAAAICIGWPMAYVMAKNRKRAHRVTYPGMFLLLLMPATLGTSEQYPRLTWPILLLVMAFTGAGGGAVHLVLWALDQSYQLILNAFRAERSN